VEWYREGGRHDDAKTYQHRAKVVHISTGRMRPFKGASACGYVGNFGPAWWHDASRTDLPGYPLARGLLEPAQRAGPSRYLDPRVSRAGRGLCGPISHRNAARARTRETGRQAGRVRARQPRPAPRMAATAAGAAGCRYCGSPLGTRGHCVCGGASNSSLLGGLSASTAPVSKRGALLLRRAGSASPAGCPPPAFCSDLAAPGPISHRKASR
jgi:hypothetical protein